MSDQQQLFENPAVPKPAIPPSAPEEAEEPTWTWLAELLLPATLEMMEIDVDISQFHEDDKKRIAGIIADELAQAAEWELMKVAMINQCPPFDDLDLGSF